MNTLLSVITAVSSIVLIISVVLQESEQAGLGTLDGTTPDALWGSNRGTSKKEILKRITIISSAVFLVSLLLLAKF